MLLCFGFLSLQKSSPNHYRNMSGAVIYVYIKIQIQFDLKYLKVCFYCVIIEIKDGGRAIFTIHEIVRLDYRFFSSFVYYFMHMLHVWRKRKDVSLMCFYMV